ncbi:MAG: hypothetical protein IJV22_05975 [Bacteroidales bacterium]|nr:hypothetical protein [Bacteroidales bacterium]
MKAIIGSLTPLYGRLHAANRATDASAAQRPTNTHTNMLHNLKHTILTFAAIAAGIGGMGQKSDTPWSRIDKLMERGSYQQADTSAQQLFASASASDDTRSLLLAACYLADIEAAYKENASDSTQARFRLIMPRLGGIELAIAHAHMARFYKNYRDANRWRLADNRPTDEADPDYKLWSLSQFDDTIRQHVAQMLADLPLLQRTSVADVEPFCTKLGSKGLLLTPTLFDVLTEVAVECSSSTAESIRLRTNQVNFHRTDAPCLRIHWEHELCDLLIDDQPHNALAIVQDCIDRNASRDCPEAAYFYYRKALLLRAQKNDVEARQCCLKVVKSFEKGEWTAACQNLISQIEAKEIALSLKQTSSVGLDILGTATCRNLNHLYFRIIEQGEWHKSSTPAAYLRSQPVLKAWDQSVPERDDYQAQTVYIYLPSMPAGKYALLASPTKDFATAQGLVCTDFVVSDVVWLVADDRADELSGYVVGRASGKPLAGQTVQLFVDTYRNRNLLSTTKTDRNGWFSIKNIATNRRGLLLSTTYKGLESTQQVYLHTDYRDSSVKWACFPDRPVYKPGEEVNYMVVCYQVKGLDDGRTLQGRKARMRLVDVNNRELAEDTLRTDAYGTASSSFHLPADALPGNYHLRMDGHGYLATLRVEAYKQPKFTVELPADNSLHQLGRSAEVGGSAVSYTGVPLSGGQVEYTVEREEMRPWWRWWWNTDDVSERKVVASGRLSTSNEGAFHFQFMLTPDSSVSKPNERIYRFRITAKVTDLNGETHEAHRTIVVGRTNSYLTVELQDEMSTLDTLAFAYNNLEGAPIEGRVRLQVERLRQPEHPRLSHPLMSADGWHALDEKTFAERYPVYAYRDDYNKAASWPVVQTMMDTYINIGREAQHCVALPKLPSGTYRITLHADDGHGDTTSTYRVVTLTLPVEKKVQSQRLLWTSLSTTRAYVGEKVHLRYGSRHSNTTMYYTCVVNGQATEHRVLNASDKVGELSVEVTDQMLGGFTINVCAVHDAVVEHETFYVDVPRKHKQLQLEWHTFRNKLEPGGDEQWTVRVVSPTDSSASLLMTMYDAALEELGTLAWTFAPWHSNGSKEQLRHVVYDASSLDFLVRPKWVDGKTASTIVWSLRSYGQSGRMPRGRVMFKTATVNMSRSVAVEKEVLLATVSEEDAEEEVVYMVAEPANTDAGTGAKKEEVALRSNLNPLAFFRPSMTTDDSGRVSFSFTIPELLTKWSIRGLALTQDLQFGTLADAAITMKRLMVVPNVPRFIRCGDTADFLTKVVNSTDSVQVVAVKLDMYDAETGQPLLLVQDEAEQYLTLGPRENCSVRFRLHVGDDARVARYRIVARGENCSDGEQGEIPVLSNRTLITESMAMYINGKGEKQFTLSSLATVNSSTLKHHALAVEATANPIWYAIQALPYMAELENPSNIYLVNSVYVNTLAQAIVRANPQIEQVFRTWQTEQPEALQSALEKNEQLKQTLLHETPWLRDANNEAQRKTQLATFFDETRIKTAIEGAASKLFADQHADGSWGWMPQCRWGSVYITQYVLKAFGRMVRLLGTDVSSAMTRALDYVDSKNYEAYLWYLNHPSCGTTDVDYLYTRSFYSKASLSSQYKKAYDYMYNNAKRRYTEFTSLYTRAQLALVFHRAGDKRIAADIVRRLKSSSLRSDEMGMYWRDNQSGFLWNERPIEVQSLLIEAFEEITPEDKESASLMRQWLLKQKQTTRWNSDVATVNAVTALMGGSPSLDDGQTQSLTMRVAGKPVETAKQAGTGYQTRHWPSDSITADMSHVSLSKSTDGIAWAAMYWQYFEQMDKVQASSMGLSMSKQLLRYNQDGSLSTLTEQSKLKVGDKVKVRILIAADRNLEYVELRDGRASILEPVSSRSGWQYGAGMSYYVAVYDASTSFFIDRLEKGNYVLEYDLYVASSGDCTMGLTTIQCMYSPEFRATCAGVRLHVPQVGNQ